MPIAARFEKAPGATLDFDLDFADEMAEAGDTARDIAPVDLAAPSGITVVAAVWIAEIQRIKVWLSGGTDGKKYVLTAWLNTAGGRRLEMDFLVRIKD